MVHVDAPTPDRAGATTRYQRLFDLAEGGMGRVELSVRRGPSFQRLYAVKRLRPAVAADADARAMFLEEGRLAGLIHHPNVVPVLDVGEDERGPFLVIEYVGGITARDVIVEAQRSALPTSVQIGCRIVAQAARGLAAAHDLTSHDGGALGLVHRDVSPHNILIGFDGVVRVTDFGIAKVTGREHRTSSGVLKGKLGYMAPEVLQFRGADARTDLFALGVVFYELLAGRRLYGGEDDGARARRILDEPPPDIGELRMDVAPDAQQLLVSLLAKDPADRPESARAVADRLDAIVHQLVELEGAHPLEEFVREAFGSVQAERQRAIQTALGELAGAAEADPTTTSEATRPALARRWSQRATALALALVLGATGGVVFAVADSGEPPARATTSSDAAPPELPAAAAPARVTIEVETVPPGAWVEIEGLEPVRTPASVELPRSTDRRQLTLTLDGYARRIESVVPDESRHLELVLAALPSPPARERRAARRESPSPRSKRASPLDTYW
ncbi:serine/threonine-protein kinase [Sandaracinus amylolyticus]|uniref:Serine/threonine protein kinase PrkC, regulator of stationary phase n=1 Tax=Sandaracinus amylolyticus TaxID=927083 RepID=A0A0F6YK81_9BACT|nr:serine/threonine-protein kinase [Sandaracinus amylolyticus]AKF08985.1 Serine/threonine protein kinase PrkC, regulator of stationary phase [Sandaracinus amylolyticus]